MLRTGFGVESREANRYILITETEKGLKLLYNVKDLFVDIFSDLFPACNIQICSTLEPVWYEKHECWYGFFWEMMFDTGHVIEVSQNLAAYKNKKADFLTEPRLEEATILIYDSVDDYTWSIEPDHGIMTKTLEELRDELKKQIEIINRVKEPV